MGHSDHCQGKQCHAAQAAARRAALADTPTRVRSSGQWTGGCPACREVSSLLRRQNRLLERLLRWYGWP